MYHVLQVTDFFAHVIIPPPSPLLLSLTPFSLHSCLPGLEANRALRILRIDNNNLGNAGGEKLADLFSRHMMMNYSLRLLMMQGNKLGPIWGMAMAEMISHNNTLTEISLKDNRFDGDCGASLVQSYAFNPVLIELHLSYEEIGDEATESLRAVLRSKKSLPVTHAQHEKEVQDRMLEVVQIGGGEVSNYADMERYRETKLKETFVSTYYT